MKRGDRIEYYEDFILFKARELANLPSEIEDFQQEGRLAAWQALQSADDRKGRIAYVQRRITWRMTDYARKVYKVAEKETVGYTPSQHNLLFGDYGEDTEE